ncbi:LLM class flavin-dependent oxidoreductase [Immundisolibacter sp.]|uniref:LLM class flavin-dependent oxidoreductase n=1 Tax=Immundisolibacter sp. TaxID=1934948 RepID=UPI002636C653|nr:LLM class flavin-dependent oxidoreductase [Immundisolibacter sp.]MDD3650631.1 LLM class flavin-dependent oxidoreductase [Immundisolibacter sp.]
MKFGLFYEMQGASDRSDVALYQEHLDQFRLADELGYDCLWLAELHFQRAYSILPAPLLLAAAASQITRRIRLGTGISVLPINHPLRLAEEIATLDILSNGRVDFGIGRGHPMTGIYEHFNVDIEQSKALFRENLGIIRLAWTEDEFSYKGKFHTIDRVRVVPKPVQKPTPPTFVSAFSPDTFDLAAEYGFNLFLPAQVIPVEQLKQAIGAYHAALAKYGRDKSHYRVPVLLPVYIDTDGARARRDVERAMMSYYDIIGVMMGEMMGRLQEKHAQFPESYKGYLQLGELTRDLNYDFVCRELAIFGSPQEAVDRIGFLREQVGLDDIILWTNVGAMPHDKVCNSMRLFAEQVMPHFA